MKLSTFILALTLPFTFLTRSPVDFETKLLTPTTWDEYYGELYEYPVILVAFHESNRSSEMTENILTTSAYLRMTEFLDSRDIPVMTVDMSLVPKVKSFYDFESSHHMWLFVRNRAYKFEGFEENMKMSDRDTGISKTYDWVHSTVNGLIVEVESLAQFKEALDKDRIVTLYIGEKNENYTRFKEWVLQFSKEPLYAVFDENVSNEIIAAYDKENMSKLTPGRDGVAVVWHPDEVNEMDSMPFQITRDFEDRKNLDLFYLFETRPRIRKDYSTSDNVFLLYQRQLPLFIFNYSEDSQSSYRLKEFNKAMRILPKRFVYDVVEHESRRAIDYQHIMIQGNNYKLMEANSIYIIWLSHGSRPQVMKFDKNFNSDEIVGWTFNFGKMFPYLFGNNEKKEQVPEEKFEAEDL
jgi:hypothetical protein